MAVNTIDKLQFLSFIGVMSSLSRVWKHKCLTIPTKVRIGLSVLVARRFSYEVSADDPRCSLAWVHHQCRDSLV